MGVDRIQGADRAHGHPEIPESGCGQRELRGRRPSILLPEQGHGQEEEGGAKQQQEEIFHGASEDFLPEAGRAIRVPIAARN
jgi:hypothetical protein